MSLTDLPAGPFTYEHLLALPEDDAHRYELFDGALLVTPSPNRVHQRCVHRLQMLLDPLARAAGLEVLPAPFDVRLAEDRILEPDVLVLQPGPGTQKITDEAPALVVEVLSPSTRSIDHLLKRHAYEQRGIAAYWIVDPIDPDGPAITVLEHEGGRYVERARVVGEESYGARTPFEVTLVPARLVEDPGTTTTV